MEAEWAVCSTEERVLLSLYFYYINHVSKFLTFIDDYYKTSKIIKCIVFNIKDSFPH